MKEVKVSQLDLLKAVTANRAKHIEEYIESVEGYKERAITDLKQALKRANAGIEVDFNAIARLAIKPQSHERDYDRAILMLQMSTADEIVLSQVEFDQLVMDEWSWKNTFGATAALYKKGI